MFEGRPCVSEQFMPCLTVNSRRGRQSRSNQGGRQTVSSTSSHRLEPRMDHRAELAKGGGSCFLDFLSPSTTGETTAANRCAEKRSPFRTSEQCQCSAGWAGALASARRSLSHFPIWDAVASRDSAARSVRGLLRFVSRDLMRSRGVGKSNTFCPLLAPRLRETT